MEVRFDLGRGCGARMNDGRIAEFWDTLGADIEVRA